MLPATKRLKLSTIEKGTENLDTESGFHSQVDISCSNSNASDFAQPRRKSYCLASQRGSYKQQSFDTHQLSSGYGSSFSLSGSSAAFVSPVKSRKRKSEVSESDENFYNSYQFVSPLKVRKLDEKSNRAKLILKEKCASENVILSSTPIRNEQRVSKWGNFRSFHPEKLQFGKSIEGQISPPAAVLKEISSSSFNISSFNLSGSSFLQDNIPEHVHNLWTGDIKNETVTSKTHEPPRINKTPERQFVNGRQRFDILGKRLMLIYPLNITYKITFTGMLHARQDIALGEILKYMDDKSLLSLSHVSKNYRQMITSNKAYETTRKNYLKHHRSILENKYPNNVNTQRTSQGVKKAFGQSNLNHMSLRQRPVTPPQSPKRHNSSYPQQVSR